jgi:taurine--2-oxoglutarate transaminase
MCLAAAEAAIDVLIDEGMIENAAAMGKVMRRHMDAMQQKHRCVRECRNAGLFGIIELRKNSKNDYLVPYGGSHPVMAKVGKHFRENGLFTVLQWGGIMCNPPLCINEQQIAEAFAIIDQGLAMVDEVFEG